MRMVTQKNKGRRMTALLCSVRPFISEYRLLGMECRIALDDIVRPVISSSSSAACVVTLRVFTTSDAREASRHVARNAFASCASRCRFRWPRRRIFTMPVPAQMLHCTLKVRSSDCLNALRVMHQTKID